MGNVSQVALARRQISAAGTFCALFSKVKAFWASESADGFTVFRFFRPRKSRQ